MIWKNTRQISSTLLQRVVFAIRLKHFRSIGHLKSQVRFKVCGVTENVLIWSNFGVYEILWERTRGKFGFLVTKTLFPTMLCTSTTYAQGSTSFSLGTPAPTPSATRGVTSWRTSWRERSHLTSQESPSLTGHSSPQAHLLLGWRWIPWPTTSPLSVESSCSTIPPSAPDQ